MMISNKVYDVMKWFCLVFIPAFITFYGVIGTTCNIPYTEQVLILLSAFDTFFGSILGVSSMKYNEDKKND
ncbi:MAG: phage holin [Paludibacteraceae bacterium]|nr:phage holin [Paludibacteraceae bacterium]